MTPYQLHSPPRNTVLVNGVKYGVDRQTVRQLAEDRGDLRAGLAWLLDNWTAPALRAADIDSLRALVERGGW